MSPSPETRPSLLIRIADRGDAAAWREFAQIYTPVVRRLAKSKGLQAADADDLAQQVLTAVSKAIERWEVDPERGRFRTWLYRITQNHIINAFTRRSPERATGEAIADVHALEPATTDGPTSEQIRLEFRREVFRWAAHQVQAEFSATNWQAFWQTAVENRRAEEVAKELKLTCGAVYTARSRAMKRLKDKVQEFEEE
jgi:RNA polymerase sigma-70 factor (ECF subfamily)